MYWIGPTVLRVSNNIQGNTVNDQVPLRNVWILFFWYIGHLQVVDIHAHGGLLAHMRQWVMSAFYKLMSGLVSLSSALWPDYIIHCCFDFQNKRQEILKQNTTDFCQDIAFDIVACTVFSTMSRPKHVDDTSLLHVSSTYAAFSYILSEAVSQHLTGVIFTIIMRNQHLYSSNTSKFLNPSGT